MSISRIFPAIPNDLREWTRYLSRLFAAREFDTTLLGCTTVPSGTARYTMSAGIVCLTLPGLSATSDSITAVMTGLPDEITPEHDQYCLARIIDSGVTAVGLVQIGSDTGITLYKDLNAGSFATSGVKGLNGSIVVYSLD